MPPTGAVSTSIFNEGEPSEPNEGQTGPSVSQEGSQGILLTSHHENLLTSHDIRCLLGVLCKLCDLCVVYFCLMMCVCHLQSYEGEENPLATPAQKERESQYDPEGTYPHEGLSLCTFIQAFNHLIVPAFMHAHSFTPPSH